MANLDKKEQLHLRLKYSPHLASGFNSLSFKTDADDTE